MPYIAQSHPKQRLFLEVLCFHCIKPESGTNHCQEKSFRHIHCYLLVSYWGGCLAPVLRGGCSLHVAVPQVGDAYIAGMAWVTDETFRLCVHRSNREVGSYEVGNSFSLWYTILFPWYSCMGTHCTLPICQGLLHQKSGFQNILSPMFRVCRFWMFLALLWVVRLLMRSPWSRGAGSQL